MSNSRLLPRGIDVRTLAMVAEKTDNLVIITDPRGFIEWVNQGFERTTGYTLEETLGKRPGQLLQGQETCKDTVKLIGNAIAEQRPITTEILNFSKSGRPYWLHINIQPIFDEGGELLHFVAIELDLTEQKAQEQEIRQLADQLKAALDTKNRFFSIIAHDLRSPFSGLIQLMKFLSHDIDRLSREQLRMLIDDLLERSESTLGLLENLLEWAQKQTGHMTCEPERLDLYEVFEQAIKPLLHAAEGKQLRIRWLEDTRLPKDVEAKGHTRVKDEPAWVHADQQMLLSIARNLLSNAIKFSHPNSEIRLTLEKSAHHYVLTVTDQGVGMDERQLDNLFRLDVKTQKEGTAGEKGSGLGLALCQEFVRLNHGRLTCRSKLGRGTSFQLHLPVSQAKDVAQSLAISPA